MDILPDNKLLRSQSAHLSQKMLFLQTHNLNKKNTIKLLKQSFPPDFFTNKQDFLKNKIPVNPTLPKIRDLKIFFSRKDEALSARILDSKRMLGLKNITIERNNNEEKGKRGVVLLKKEMKRGVEEKIDEINTPCFPSEKKNYKPRIRTTNDNKRKIVFCKEKEIKII